MGTRPMKTNWRSATLPCSLEAIATEHPEACGCGFCHYGLLAWPDPAALDAPLFTQRAMALRLGRLRVCECAAGEAQRRQAMRVLDSLPRGCGVNEAKGVLNWEGKPPAEYVPGSWWAAVRAAELIEFEAVVPTFHGG
jgi:hypothetical protein